LEEKGMKKRWFALAAVVLAWGVALLLLVSISGDTGLGLFGSVRAAPMAGEPTITEVVPSSASNDLDTPIVITGTGFVTGAEVLLGATSLDNVQWVNSARLAADVPWGMMPGVYTLTVVNPGGQQASLPGAFTVTQGLGVWTTGGPYGGMVERLVLDPLTPTTLYAPIFQVGLLASYDGADHWEPILPGGYIYPAVDTQNSDVIYAGGGGGLLRSLDGGMTWESITILDPSIGCFIHRPVPHPTSEGVVYVATAASPPAPPIPGEGGIYRSLDYGDHWLTMTTGLTDTHVVALAFDPQDPETMAAGTDAGNLFVSDNAGETWTWRARVGVHFERFYYNSFQDHEAWAIPMPDWPSEPPYLYKSVDPDLRVWAPVTVTGETGFSGLVFALAFVPDTVLAATSCGVYTSTDSGATWMQTVGLQGCAAELVIDPQHPDVMYAGSGPGLFKTTDGGTSWNEANEGLAGVVPFALAVSPVDPDTVYAKTHELGLLKSYNGGRAWASNEVWTGGPPAPGLLAVDPFTPTRLYLAGACAGAPCIRIGEDEDTWHEHDVALPVSPGGWCGEGSAVDPHPTYRGRVLAGAELYLCEEPEDERSGQGQIYISHDFGEQWTPMASGQPISRVIEFAFDSGDPDLVYAATAGTGLWKSTDGGTSWESCPFPGFQTIESVAVHPSISGLVYAVDTHLVERIGLYRSEDAGATWEEMPYVPELPGINYGYRLLFVPSQPATLYTGCEGDISGLCRSADGGYTWEFLEGSPRVIVLAEGSDGERVVIYVGTGGGVVTQQTIAAAVPEVIPGRGSLISAGVHRMAFRLPAYWLYLPLVARSY
jgi:photosystem II stability/assembly factor-like uncharacterized protein